MLPYFVLTFTFLVFYKFLLFFRRKYKILQRNTRKKGEKNSIWLQYILEYNLKMKMVFWLVHIKCVYFSIQWILSVRTSCGFDSASCGLGSLVTADLHHDGRRWDALTQQGHLFGRMKLMIFPWKIFKNFVKIHVIVIFSSSTKVFPYKNTCNCFILLILM